MGGLRASLGAPRARVTHPSHAPPRIPSLPPAGPIHPILRADWNKLTVELWTHARQGLTGARARARPRLHPLCAAGLALPALRAQNDFILAAKIDAIDKEGLLRGKKKALAES